MSRIIDLCVDYFRLPLEEVLRDAMHGDHTHFELVVVTLRTEDGIEGVGYTYTGGLGGHAIEAVISHDLKPVLIGMEGSDVEELHDTMQRHLHYVARGGIASFAISAVDIALWDVRGKRTDEPLWQMAGGCADRCRAYRGGIDLNYPQEKLLNSVRGHLDDGFNAIKIGFLAVIVFMAIYYRWFGMIANVALFSNLVFISAVLSMLGASLTLPGRPGPSCQPVRSCVGSARPPGTS